MSSMVYMYGFGFGGSPGRNVTVHVTYGGAAGSGANVVCTNGKKTFYGITDADGNFAFKLTKGTWTITANKNGSTSTVNAEVTGDCTVDIALFAATINVTYPAGSTCTATNGTTTLTAPDTSGTWKCVVPNAGTWRVMIGNVAGDDVNVTTNGNTYTVNTWYLFKNGKQFVPFTARKNGSFANNVINANGYSAWSSASVSTTNKISIKNCSTLVFVVQVTQKATSDQSPNGYYGISTENMIEDGYRVAAAYKTSVGTETLTVDVSKISGSYYAGVKTWKVDAKVSQIYLVV